ncbi:MAG TPA: ribbon-helix-helix protein, CopG family [Candidatus Dormibacteraeota bacterium]|nr:ribbon-helix-helix protein, CopG family [Candidatus Dormibacteraeota bacterium]
MKKKAKSAEEVVNSTLRLPRPLWEQINHIAIDRRLSMAQAIIQAVAEYCKREGRK